IRLTPEQGHLVFLISGGASSLVEVLPPGAGLGELQRINGWLLGSGLDIVAMNRVRTAISCIKGGRLRSRLGQRRTEAYLISDVPGDDPAVIGSGLLVPPSVLRPLPELPSGIREWVTSMAARVPDCADAPVVPVPVHVIATLRDACQGAAAAAERCGMDVTLHGEFLCGEAAVCGERLARELLAGPPGIHIWGGETTVTLPADPGQGGRNQHLALAAARVLEGHPGVTLLAAGTDGSDGNTQAAGALVDAGTVARARALGLDLEQALAGANAHALLKACGDLVTTGPTGTNVMDLMIGIRQSWTDS
ncbi:MOFRL family protein, partial [Ectothiorhodospira lacustris]